MAAPVCSLSPLALSPPRSHSVLLAFLFPFLLFLLFFFFFWFLLNICWVFSLRHLLCYPMWIHSWYVKHRLPGARIWMLSLPQAQHTHLRQLLQHLLQLTFCGDFNQPADYLPAHLQQLSTCGNFDHPVAQLPANLQQLTLRGSFNHPLLHLLSLQHLILICDPCMSLTTIALHHAFHHSSLVLRMERIAFRSIRLSTKSDPPHFQALPV